MDIKDEQWIQAKAKCETKNPKQEVCWFPELRVAVLEEGHKLDLTWEVMIRGRQTNMGWNVQKPMSITEQNVLVQENGQEKGERQVSRK